MHDDLEDLTPARVLKSRYILESRLTAPGSTSGIVAERARLGLATRPTEGYQGDGAAGVRAELCWLLGLCTDLTSREERVARAFYGSTGGQVTYERLIRTADLEEGSGEDVIDISPRDLDGNLLVGWIKVRGIKARLPTYAEAAAALAADGMLNADGAPMSGGAVKKVLSGVSEKLWAAIRARQAMAQWEDRSPG